MSSIEKASPTAPRRDRWRASDRVARLSATASLDRAVVRLEARAVALEGRLDDGEDVWTAYGETVTALAAALPRLEPGGGGEFLSTSEMAQKLGLAPKTLLRHMAAGAVKPALRRGKLIRWRGTEVLR